MSAEPDIARSDSFNYNEAMTALDFHAVKAQKRGDYGAHADLKAVADFIDGLQAKIDMIMARAAPMEVVFHVPEEPPECRERSKWREEE